MAKAKGKKGKTTAEKPDAKKTERYTLAYRDCDLPTNISFRTQNHGDDKVQATDIRVSGIELSKEETNALLQEPRADRALWSAGSRGKPERPTIAGIEPIKLSDTIESARVAIKVGGEEIKLGASKLKSVTVQPKLGGVAHLSCMVQSTPAINAKLAALISGMDGKARIQIDYEHNAEQLEAFDADEAKKSGDPELEQFEKDAKSQVDAFQRGTAVGDSAPADTH